MIAKREYAVIRAAATRVAEAGNRAARSLADGSVEHEPDLTNRILGGIQEAMNGYVNKGVRWTAKTLTATKQEPEFGADFAGVLDINLKDFRVKKGFLAQAKRIEPSASVRKSDLQRMKSQCELMLQHSPDSFLFLYSIRGVSVVPALSVVSGTFKNPHELYARNLKRFYEDHFECFIGDKAISKSNAAMLDSLRQQYRLRKLSYLRARYVQ